MRLEAPIQDQRPRDRLPIDIIQDRIDNIERLKKKITEARNNKKFTQNDI